MNILLSCIGITISILAIFINQWITFLPWLGIGFQYHKVRYQIMIAVVAISLAIGAYLIQPLTGQRVVFFVVLGLTPLSGFTYANKTLVPVDNPEYVSAQQTGLEDETRVLGYLSKGNAAYAWTLDTLIPHHLVNDTIEGEPILVGW